jgi:hypothetical protein
MTHQTSDSKKPDGDTNITVLFGIDDHGKPRGAYFEAVDSEQMTRAAAAMKLRLLRPITASQIELAKKLPVGRIHANGTGFVPPIRPGLYSALQLAAESPQQSGTTASTVAPPPTAARGAPGLPASWDEIDVGHLVLSQAESDEGWWGWWESIVVARDNDMLTVKWRNYPKEPLEVRHRTAVALLKPTVVSS